MASVKVLAFVRFRLSGRGHTEDDHEVVVPSPPSGRVDYEEARPDRSECHDWKSQSIHEEEAVKSMADRNQLRNHIIKRLLSGGCEANQDIRTNELVDRLRRGRDTASHQSEKRCSNEEISTTKDIRETTHESSRDAGAQGPRQSNPVDVLRRPYAYPVSPHDQRPSCAGGTER